MTFHCHSFVMQKCCLDKRPCEHDAKSALGAKNEVDFTIQIFLQTKKVFQDDKKRSERQAVTKDASMKEREGRTVPEAKIWRVILFANILYEWQNGM